MQRYEYALMLLELSPEAFLNQYNSHKYGKWMDLYRNQKGNVKGKTSK